jgi:hypothetical protein
MTTIGHIMIGATITAVFSIYTILNICEYVTTHVLETEKNLIIYYDYKIKELNKTIDLLSEKVNLLESTNNDEEKEEKDIDICDIYDSEPLDFSCEQLQLLLGEKVVVEESDKSDSDIVVEDVVKNEDDIVVEDVEEEINEYNNIPDLVELDNTDDVKRVKDSLLVIARKILIGV